MEAKCGKVAAFLGSSQVSARDDVCREASSSCANRGVVDFTKT